MSRRLDLSRFEILFKACGKMYINLWRINHRGTVTACPLRRGKLMEEVTWKYFTIFPPS